MQDRDETKGAGAMRSQINWALLGLVIERPSYGYELAARFERVYGDILHVSSNSHIYKALDSLVGRSMIRASPEANPVSSGTDRQPKRHYFATDQGRKRYQKHLVEQMREARRRSQLLARQLAVFESKPQVALEIIDAIEEACLEEAIRAPMSPPSLGPSTDFGSALIDRLAAEESRVAMEEELRWIACARREFKALAEGEVSPG